MSQRGRFTGWRRSAGALAQAIGLAWSASACGSDEASEALGACDAGCGDAAQVAADTEEDVSRLDVPAGADAAEGLDVLGLPVDAGPDRDVVACAVVSLAASGAPTPSWRQVSGPLVRAWRTDEGIGFVAPVSAVATTLEFEATAGDASDRVRVAVAPSSDPLLGPGLVRDCGRFTDGVASGDPTADGVVLWTRLDASAPETVTWVVARDALLEDVVATGEVTVGPDQDYTARVEVAGLAPGSTWFYGFAAADGSRSALGRTKTAPVGPVERARVATMSCSSLWSGYFNAYRRLAERDVDLVVHLGDYVYDFVDEQEHVRLPPGAFPESPQNRAAWRTRFREYLSDPDLRAARAAHPWVAIWDNHDADEADEPGQETTAVFREYVPMRLPDPAQPRRAWRSVAWGDLFDLALLDVLLWREPGDMLGAPQRQWLEAQLTGSTAAWRLVGNQKLMSTLDVGTSSGSFAEASPWDEFPETRAEVFELFGQVGDVVVLSGDLHFTAAHDLVLSPDAYDPKAGAGAVGAELLAAGITRGNFDETLCGGECGADSAVIFDAIAAELLAANPHASHYELIQHGYGVLEVTPDRVDATVWYSPIRGLADTEAPGPTLSVSRGANRWTRPPADAPPSSP